MENQPSFLDRFFHLSENGTTVRTEILAGITTFMTMAYILAVNPTIMSAAGMDKGAVLTATALASFIGTLCMAFFANYPFALAPGMGLNAFFAFTVVLQMGYTWEMALAAVFFEGLIFIVLSLTNVREAIFNAIPITLKKAVSAGIGLFIAFFVVFCCMNFHRRILSPAFRQFEEDRRESRRRMDELQLERQQMQTELSRLADVCRNESVPDAFQTFVAGIPTLTKTERRIFDGYAAGLRTREIVEQLDIKDSTLRFHNKNIYEKLGVSSLKQLQQFAAILNSGGNSAPDSAQDESGPKKAR